MDFLIALAALCFLMFVAYRGFSVILFAPIAALGAVFLTDPHAVPAAFTNLFMVKMVGFAQLYFPGLPARRGVRQGDRAFRLRQVDRRDDHPRRRQGAGDAGDRARLRGPDLRRRVAVRRGVRRLSVRGGAVPRRRHPQAADPRHDRARRLLLHHGRAAVHPADPEHHPDHLLQDHDRRRADPRHHRRDLHLRLRHDLSRVAEAARPRADGEGYGEGHINEPAAGRHDPSAVALDRLPAADRGVRASTSSSAASRRHSPA